MLKIIFDTFEKNPGKIVFHIKTFDGENFLKDDEIFIKFPEIYETNDNLIAIALSTLCGTKYDYIYIDLIINEGLKEKISFFTQSIVETKDINTEEFINKNNDNIALNFSGGLDSLSAKYLFGDYAELISIAFFGNEYNFFKKFSPHIIDTNFRQLGYAENHWTFMGVGAILLSDALNLRYHTFGTILEAFHLHATLDYSSKESFIEPPFQLAGLNDIKLIQGLTEIGTALISSTVYPYLINDSLISLSMPGTEKRYRKQLIIQILKKKFNLNNIYVELTEPPAEENRLKWGSFFAIDFLVLYILKYAGINETNNIMLNIPNEVIEFVENHRLDFYEKFNPNFLNNIPNSLKKEVTRNLLNANIFMYNQRDFNELNEVIKFLSKYHAHLNDIVE